MIFVTVGTQLPFERLLETVDQWAKAHPEQKVFAQVGKTQYVPVHFETVVSMTPNEYDTYLSTADVIIGHVGMGTIISGIQHAKPLVLMPRHADKGEHRNDHQLSTARQFTKFSLVNIADSYEELDRALNDLLYNKDTISPDEVLEVSSNLVARISNFIERDFNGKNTS